MPNTLRLGDDELRFTLPIGEVLTVVAPAGSSAYVKHLNDFVPSATVTGSQQNFGPFAVSKTMRMTCTAGAVSWDVARAAPSVDDGFSTWEGRGVGSALYARKFITDIGDGGITVRWNGTYWRAVAATDLVFDVTPSAGVANAADQVIKTAALPAGILRLGHRFVINVLFGKSGTTDAGTATKVRLGPLGTTADPVIATVASTPTGAGRTYATQTDCFLALATQLRLLSQQGGMTPWNAVSSAVAYPQNIPISDADSTALILSAGMQLAGSTDTPQVHHMVLTVYP